MKSLTLTVAATLALTISAVAQVVNVKFRDNVYTGSGIVGPGTNWNFFSGTSGTTASSLKTSQGGNTSISVQVTYGSNFGGGSVSGSAPVYLLGSGLYGPFSFSFSGLDPTARYTIFTFHYDKAGRATTTQLSGISTTSQTPTSTIVKTEFVEGGNYLRFGSISPSASGSITCSSSVAWGGLNGIQIVRVPDFDQFKMVATISPALGGSGPRISGILSGGPAAGLSRIEASSDFTDSDSWTTIGAIQLDSLGAATFSDIEDTSAEAIGATFRFFRAAVIP